MTISSETRKAGPFTGNSATTVFPFAFKVFTKADLLVQLTTLSSGAIATLTVDSDFTVALNADQDANPGGSVTYNPSGVPMPATQTLTVACAVGNTQGTTLNNGGAYDAKTIERAFDRVTILVQQAIEKVNRALRFPIVDATLTSELPTAAIRATKGLKFDANGNLTVTVNDPDTSVVAAAASATAAAASATAAGVSQTAAAASATAASGSATTAATQATNSSNSAAASAASAAAAAASATTATTQATTATTQAPAAAASATAAAASATSAAASATTAATQATNAATSATSASTSATTATTQATTATTQATTATTQATAAAASATSAAASATAAAASAGAGDKNLLTNHDGIINQRGSAAAGTDDTYDFDRWYILTQTASVGFSRLTDVADGTPFMMRMTQSQASAQRMGRAQIIEGRNCKKYRGQTVTLTPKARISNSQAIRYAILEWTGTEDAVISDVVNSWTNGTYTAGNFFINTTTTVSGVAAQTPAANTLTVLNGLTVTLGSSFNNLIVLAWTEGTAAQNVTLDLAMQLEAGAASTAFEQRNAEDEFNRCCRHLRQFTSVLYSEMLGGIGAMGNGGGQASFGGYFRMRATPTGTYTGAGPLLGDHHGGLGAVTSMTVAATGADSFINWYINSGAVGAGGEAAYFLTNAGGYVRLDAEL